MVNATHSLVSKVVNTVKNTQVKIQPNEGGIYKPGSYMDRRSKELGMHQGSQTYKPPAAVGSDAKKPSAWHLPGLGISGGKPASPAAPQHPVSHPGTSATRTPIKAAVGNRGHATVHPPKPHTAPTHPTRHTRPPHAVRHATGGTQHTHSSGPAAGHPHPKKPKKPKLHHHHKMKHHKVKKPKKPKG